MGHETSRGDLRGAWGSDAWEGAGGCISRDGTVEKGGTSSGAASFVICVTSSRNGGRDKNIDFKVPSPEMEPWKRQVPALDIIRHNSSFI